MFLLGVWVYWYFVFYGCSVNFVSGEVIEEGVLRGDKGVKIDIEVDQIGYLMCVVVLVRGEVYLLVGVFLCFGFLFILVLIFFSYQVLKVYYQFGLYYSFYLIIFVICLFIMYIFSIMIGSFSILYGVFVRVVKWI